MNNVCEYQYSGFFLIVRKDSLSSFLQGSYTWRYVIGVNKENTIWNEIAKKIHTDLQEKESLLIPSSNSISSMLEGKSPYIMCESEIKEVLFKKLYPNQVHRVSSKTLDKVLSQAKEAIDMKLLILSSVPMKDFVTYYDPQRNLKDIFIKNILYEKDLTVENLLYNSFDKIPSSYKLKHLAQNI